MSRKNGRNIHGNRLKPSKPDDVQLALAVESRFLQLCELWFRTRGQQLVPPESLDKDMLRWRQMRVRHKSGDLRHSEMELYSVRTVAQWTLDMNCILRNQPTAKPIEWKD